MGTKCSPNYPNIFMGKSERNFIYSCLQTFSDFYCRFIDGIFLLWNGSETQLLDFITRFNFRHPTIKLDFKYSKSRIELLGRKIYKKKEKQITNDNISETNRLGKFLDPTSAHP